MLINRKIPGQLREEEQFSIALLAKLVPTNGKIVEVGSLLGRSSWLWAQNADPSVTVFCIDPWKKPAEEIFKNLQRRAVKYFHFNSSKLIRLTAPILIPCRALAPKILATGTKR